jgi:hypothetical protein
MRAIINTPSMKTTNKSNGGVSELHRATVTDGPLKGQIVLVNRTVKNKDGVAKSPCEENDEVNLHMSKLSAEQSTTGKVAFFFEVEKDSIEFERVETATGSALEALLQADEVGNQEA